MVDKDLDWAILVINGESSHSNYLFQTLSGRIEFVVIDTEMAQLNDYCVLSLNETARKFHELENDVKNYRQGIERIVDAEFGEITQDVIMGLEQFEIPIWQDNYFFVSKAVCLILLSTFLEKSLRSLCIAFSQDGRLPRQRGGESKISMYITHLKNVREFNFSESNEFIELREECRKIRNAFAHGDWDSVRSEIVTVSLHQSFSAVTSLFHILEEKIYPEDFA